MRTLYKLAHEVRNYCEVLWHEGLATVVYTALWTLWITACLLWLVHAFFMSL